MAFPLAIPIAMALTSLAMKMGAKFSNDPGTKQGLNYGSMGVGLLGGLSGMAGAAGGAAGSASGGSGAIGPLMQNGSFFSGGGGGAMSGAGGMAGPLMESGSFSSGGGTPPGGGMPGLKDPMGLTSQLMKLFGGGGTKSEPPQVAPQSGVNGQNLASMAQNYLYQPTATQAAARESQEDPYARLRRIRSHYYG